MATIIFYNFILLSSTLFVWLSEKGKRLLDRWIFLWIAFLIIFIPSAIRYGIGTDFFNYINIYNHINNYEWMEEGFYYINLFLRNLDAPPQWSIVIFSFIFSFIAFLAYPQKNGWVIHFIFMAMLWFFSLNGIRQAIAISFCLLALFKYFNKKILWFFILTGLGSLFHKSALFISLIGILALIPIRQSLKMYLFPWIFIGFITFTFISMSIVTFYIEQILSISGLTKYASYFGSEHFSEREFGSGLGILIKVLFSIYIIINSKSILNLNKNYWCLILLVFIYTLGAILANNIIIFSRMADTFVISIIISSYVLLQIPDNIRLNKIIVILFSIFLLLSFIKTSFGIPTTYSDPMLNPYDSIL